MGGERSDHYKSLQDRRAGSPSWRWSHTHKDYPTGWVVSSALRNTHYRLSIIYAAVEDSGEYRCESRLGLVNSLRLVVTNLQCPPLLRSHHQEEARLSSTHNHIGAVVSVSCPTGWRVAGSSRLHCRDDGTWSQDTPPHCVPVQCPPLEISSPHLQVLSLNNSYLGTASFSCPLGYTLSPPLSSIWCGVGGAWSDRVPACHLTQCPEPSPPPHATTTTSGVRVGDTATTSCRDGFLLVGEEVTR